MANLECIRKCIVAAANLNPTIAGETYIANLSPFDEEANYIVFYQFAAVCNPSMLATLFVCELFENDPRICEIAVDVIEIQRYAGQVEEDIGGMIERLLNSVSPQSTGKKRLAVGHILSEQETKRICREEREDSRIRGIDTLPRDVAWQFSSPFPPQEPHFVETLAKNCEGGESESYESSKSSESESGGSESDDGLESNDDTNKDNIHDDNDNKRNNDNNFDNGNGGNSEGFDNNHDNKGDVGRSDNGGCEDNDDVTEENHFAGSVSVCANGGERVSDNSCITVSNENKVWMNAQLEEAVSNLLRDSLTRPSQDDDEEYLAWLHQLPITEYINGTSREFDPVFLRLHEKEEIIIL